MLGESLQKSRDRKIQRELDQKRVAREYMRHCDQNGICSRDASLLMPHDVKAGLAMINAENRKAEMASFRAKKQQMKDKFQVQNRAI